MGQEFSWVQGAMRCAPSASRAERTSRIRAKLGGKTAGQLQEFLVVVQKCDSRNAGIDGKCRPGGGAGSRARIKQGPGRKFWMPSGEFFQAGANGRIGGRQARDEGLPRAQFLEVFGGHQGGIGDIDEGLLAYSELGHVCADLSQDGVVDLFVGTVAVFILAEYGDLITDTKGGDQELLELWPVPAPTATTPTATTPTATTLSPEHSGLSPRLVEVAANSVSADGTRFQCFSIISHPHPGV